MNKITKIIDPKKVPDIGMGGGGVNSRMAGPMIEAYDKVVV
ncbi:MAG: hypothetical protein QXR19_02380 [Candidatus Jordarchaeaceae archaeon]